MRLRYGRLVPGAILAVCAAMLLAACEDYYKKYTEETQQQEQQQQQQQTGAEQSGGSDSGGTSSTALPDVDDTWELDLEDDVGAQVWSNWNMKLDQDSDGDLDGYFGPGNWNLDGKVYSDRSIKINLHGPGATVKLRGTVSSDGKKMSGDWERVPPLPPPNHEGEWDASR
ncbi:MAG: hypothetical protein FJ225_12510 [Lentisphaerae bacterium]|nr:hypothetical protein [Lentisphaerota bacterium]